MEELEFKEKWNEVKNKLKERYAVLTDHDLVYEEGKEEQLLGHLQEKLGKSKEEVKDIIRSL